MIGLALTTTVACAGASGSTGSTNQIQTFCGVIVATNADYGSVTLTVDLTAGTFTGTTRGVLKVPPGGSTDSGTITGTVSGNTFTGTSVDGATVTGVLTSTTIGGTATPSPGVTATFTGTICG